jgi:23S rRNA (cytidine1920-2'-O)/16S rRNA (cytidine1409-2'-O)-methyltransferase
VRERTNVRELATGDLGERFPLVVADLSFISLRTVLPDLLAQAAPGADLVVRVKPQFEAGRSEAARGRGVIRDPEVWTRVLREVEFALDRHRAAIMGVMVSPITGAEGNVEFLVHARAPQGDGTISSAPAPDPDALVVAAVDEARTGRGG